MKRSYFTLLAATLTISACASNHEITQAPVQYTATRALNETGTSQFTARTLVKNDGRYQEVSGIPCKFSAPGFGASFVTPAVVTTPNMGIRTPAGSITCTYEGVDKLQVMQPHNQTTAAIAANAQNAAAGGGLIGSVIASIASSSQIKRRDASLDVYGYSSPSVRFGGE